MAQTLTHLTLRVRWPWWWKPLALGAFLVIALGVRVDVDQLVDFIARHIRTEVV